MSIIIKTSELKKSFTQGDVETHVLKGIDFEAVEGEFISIMGRSGAGKSTFMYQMSLLDQPTSGDILIRERSVATMGEAERVQFRLNNFGYVFQDYALLPELTALENVALPLLMQGKTKKHAYKEATASLERTGLGHRLNNLPSQLSGGEQQRVSIARSTVHKPEVLFADEPTANLDNVASEIVMKIFEELHAAGQTIIMVTHERQYAENAERIITIDDGRIVKEERIGKHKNQKE